MKTCKNARNCQWGNCYKPNQCAYKETMNEYDPCPKILENWEGMINKLQERETTFYILGVAQKVGKNE